jgi:hypothetical protein
VAVVKAKDKNEKDTIGLKVDDNGDPESEAIGTLGTLPAVCGYAEELEHWAWCIRNRAAENLPRCHPQVALDHAVIALVANMAARKGERLDFRKEWFDIDSDVVPDIKRDGGAEKS